MAPTSMSAAGKGVLFGAFNIVSSVFIVFANKEVFTTHGFPHPVALTCLHSLFTIAGMNMLGNFQVFEAIGVRPDQRRDVMITSASYVGYVCLTQLSLQVNSVGFYQVAKIAVTPLVCVIQWALYSATYSTMMKLSLTMVCLGVALATVADLSVTLLGMGVAFIGSCFTAAYQIFAGTMQKKLGLDSNQLVYNVAPYSFAFLLVLIPIFENVGFYGDVMMSEGNPETILGYRPTPAALFMIFLSSILGVCVTLSTFLFIHATNPVTFNVVGHLKTVMVVAGGMLYYGDGVEPLKLFGLALAIVGIYWYTQIKQKQSSIQVPISSGKKDVISVADVDKDDNV